MGPPDASASRLAPLAASQPSEERVGDGSRNTSGVGVEWSLRRFVAADAAFTPRPGSGHTWERFRTLATIASTNLSAARLIEGHLDALAILAEAGMAARTGATYGVWAARSGMGGLRAQPVAGGWRLSGPKAFCSGGRMLDRALVTAEADDGYRLFDIDVIEQVISVVPGSWLAVGMADSASETVEIGGPVIPETAAVGLPDFYTNRPGFSFGAVGVAACWYGGALGLVKGIVGQMSGSDPHALAEIGRAEAQLQAMGDVLRAEAARIDADPSDEGHRAHRGALVVRELVHQLCTDVLREVAAAGGARPLCHDAEQAQRAADLYVYLSQHHGSRDAAELGRLALEQQKWS
jgi:hypothetical protein